MKLNQPRRPSQGGVVECPDACSGQVSKAALSARLDPLITVKIRSEVISVSWMGQITDQPRTTG
ncbi:hypothetical protein OOZ51_03470 [Arthrobacter sp. MI7-26]|nr:hypothetical protein [Arthrobacter sp. MI7-26]